MSSIVDEMLWDNCAPLVKIDFVVGYFFVSLRRCQKQQQDNYHEIFIHSFQVLQYKIKYKQQMIKLTLKCPLRFEDTDNCSNFQFEVGKHDKLIIGRGQELQEMESPSTMILDVTNYSKAVSRKHASFLFSPSWKRKSIEGIPRFFMNFGEPWGQLPPNLLHQIYQFLTPIKQCVVKDLGSKLGLFKKIQKVKLKEEMEIQFGDSKILKVLGKELYDSKQEVKERIKSLSEENWSILGEEDKIVEGKQQIFKMEFNNTRFVLLMHKSVHFIGRSTSCAIKIFDNTIGRKHAHLICDENDVWLVDGNQKEKSVNGIWKKTKRHQIGIGEGNVSSIKIADLAIDIEIIDYPFYFDFSKLLSEKETKNEMSTSFLLERLSQGT